MDLKQTNTFLLVLLTITAVALCVLLLYPAKADINVNSKQHTSSNALEAANKLKASFFNLYPTLVIPSEGRQVPDSIMLMTSDGKQHSLHSLVGNKSKLVFRYSYLDCDICVDSVVAIIRRITKAQKLPNLLVISDFRDDRHFVINDKAKRHSYPVYNISNHNLGLPIENKNLPFLFIITPQLKATKIFIPFKEVPYQTGEYIRYAFNFLTKVD